MWAVGANLVLQLEALGSQPRLRTPTSTSSPNAIGDRKSTSMRARIRLCCGLSPAPSGRQERDTGGLHVGQEHRVVHVSHAVEVLEAHGVAARTGSRPPAAWYRRLDDRRAARGRPSGRSRTGSGRCRPTSGCRTRGSCSPAAEPRSTQRRPEARQSRRSSSSRGPSVTPACSLPSVTRTTRLTPRSRAGLGGREVGRHRRPGEPDCGPVRPRGRGCAGDREELVPHGELHVRGRRARFASRPRSRASGGRRGGTRAARPRHRPRAFPIAGAGSAWPTAQEAALKLREGAFVAARRTTPSSSCTGTSPESTRPCAVSCSRARPCRRACARCPCRATRRCDVEFIPTRHPAVDIVRFQLLTLALAEKRGVNPDHIRTDDPRWKRARAAYD